MFFKFFRYRGNFVASAITMILLGFVIDTGMKAYAQNQKKHEIQEVENFNRPEPSRPIQPEVPGVNRYQDDKVFLEYADSLYKVDSRDTIEKQIVKGNVKFRQSGLWMFCDSAYYYPQENSLDAFSHVRMEQGDTLFVYADKLFYDGDLHLAKLKNGPSEEKVIMINKDVTLTTDSLDYDMKIELGWYSRWGTIDDKVNTLTSLYGEYSPDTKQATFFHDVVLVNQKDNFTMLTDTLYYSTATHIANVESPTEIQSENDTIYTKLATYYTDTGDADLMSRSLIVHKDSTGNITTLEGDSIIYDNKTRISRAYMFRDPFKHSTPMVITDTAQKMTLLGGFGIYNDSTREALATIYPLLMEYSQGDTLFLRADTIKTFIITEKIPDRRRKTKSGYPEYNGIPVIMNDTVNHLFWIDTTYFKINIPYVETPLVMLLKAAPPYKKEEPKPELDQLVENLAMQSSIDSIPLLDQILPENLPLSDTGISDNKELRDSILNKDLINPIDNALDSLANIEWRDSIEFEPRNSIFSEEGDISESNDSIGVNLDDIKKYGELLTSTEDHENDIDSEDEMKEPEDSILQEFHVVLAYHRGRFFKQDMQGVADSMVLVERDSMLYMFRKPIIWSGERQVTGNRIDVHFNDSTADYAHLPEFGLMSEYVDEDFYNQIYGKEITTFFENGGLRKMDVSGNVETIFLPQEEDSTFNRLVNAESSYMEAFLLENKLDWLKMWPEVSGTVTPIFLVKRNQMYLQKFKWWSFLRPEREQYGDRIRWADNLGEVPDELEQYFLAPSDFGEPKSFTGPRIIVPPSSQSILDNIPREVPDSLYESPEFLDSLGFNMENLILPDSIDTGADSPGVIEAEKNETIEEIEEVNEALIKEAEETQLQSDDIEEEEKVELDTGNLKEEEDE